MPLPKTSKYHFSLIEYNAVTNSSAATKAVKDCTELFTRAGYKNRVLTFNNNSIRGVKFYTTALVAICRLLLNVKKGGVIGVQYPLLNNVFKYFIAVAKIKKLKFFCVIHDVESLRRGGDNIKAVERESKNFNFYDCLIVHNDSMKQWLISNGVKTKTVSLGIFDYLASGKQDKDTNKKELSRIIVYAGNLGKSRFVYHLNHIKSWTFNLYGPNFAELDRPDNTNWCGVFSPDEIQNKLHGAFGLIWDGDDIDKTDPVLGNYLKYNNPHKFSLYIAAGLPVIAPADSAIAGFIKQHNIGLLINSLLDLDGISINQTEYDILKGNISKLQADVKKGVYFTTALKAVEELMVNPNV